MKELVIGLGSNLGDRERNIAEALHLLSGEFGPPERVSSLHVTEPWGFESSNRFLNSVAFFRPPAVTEPEGQALEEALMGYLRVLLSVEERLGRSRLGSGYADRTIDLDLLFFGDTVLSVAGLTVPHPLLHQRAFVLKPLVEVCPGLVHPVMKKSAIELLEALNMLTDGY
ncbi:MAG: 2-amino-4-hydroxy-6-hydroxymethyldihydropteridine diphosphokinase [Bacteroidales bacterium]